MTEKLDLYYIYKLVKQRGRRCTNPTQKALADEATEALKSVLDNPNTSTAMSFKAKELDWRLHYATNSNAKLYADTILVAIKENNFIINKPYIKTYALGEDPRIGIFYAACSEFKGDQIKIGYTTREIDERLRKYRQKYGYELELLFHAKLDYPARVEDTISKSIKHLRVSGRTDSDSNEWYLTDVDHIRSLVIDFCKKFNYKIYY